VWGARRCIQRWLNHFDVSDGNKSGFEMVFQFAATQFALPIDLQFNYCSTR
jgi:hypothetical protein